MLNIGIDKTTVDKIRNYANDFRNQVAVAKNETERQVYDALNNKNWGTSSTVLNDIARDTFDYEKYNMIMTILWQSLDSPGREWRRVFKALGLLDHLIKNGTERVVEDARDHLHRIKVLSEFNYYEGSIDKGSGVREKAKQIVELLRSNEVIREEREKASKLRSKYVGISNSGGSVGGFAGFGGSSSSRFEGFGSSSDRGLSSSNRFSFSDNPYKASDFKSSPLERYTDDPALGDNSSSKSDEGTREVEARPKRSAKKKQSPKVAKQSSSKQSSLLEDADGDFNPRATLKPAIVPVGKPATATMPAAVDTAWDPFATAPTPAPPSQSASTSSTFDPFGTSSAAETFDPFGTASLEAALPQSSTNFASAPVPAGNLFGMLQKPSPLTTSMAPAPTLDPHRATSNLPLSTYPAVLIPNQSASTFGGLAQGGLQSGGSLMASQQPNFFGSMTSSFAAQTLTPKVGNFGASINPSLMSNQSPMIPTHTMGMNVRKNTSEDFGDFQSQSSAQGIAAVQQQPAASTADPKWGELSSLVDLGSLKTNTEKKQAEDESSGLASRKNTKAFAGLDGFRDQPSTMGFGALSGGQYMAGTVMRTPANNHGVPMSMQGGQSFGQQIPLSSFPGASSMGMPAAMMGQMGTTMGGLTPAYGMGTQFSQQPGPMGHSQMGVTSLSSNPMQVTSALPHGTASSGLNAVPSLQFGPKPGGFANQSSSFF